MSEVNSPTFILVAEHRGRLPLFHVDLYRLGPVADLSDLGLDTVLGVVGVVVVEWPEHFLGEWPEDHLLVELAVQDDETRVITLTATGPRHAAILEQVAGA